MNDSPGLHANTIYYRELDGAICHIATSCDSKLLQSVQSVGAKKYLFRETIMIFQLVHKCFVKF